MPSQLTTLETGRKPLSIEERNRFETYVAEIFRRMGMDLDSEPCKRTPHRWVQAIFDMTNGYDGDKNINVSFDRECINCDEDLPTVQIVEGPIDFSALCEHHALPFIGKAYIGYLRNDRILGLSKFTRIVRTYSSRFTTQERIAQEIANQIETVLTSVRGVIVYLQAQHCCTQCRGVREMNASTRTLEKRGFYMFNAHAVSEFMTLIHTPHSFF